MKKVSRPESNLTKNIAASQLPSRYCIKNTIQESKGDSTHSHMKHSFRHLPRATTLTLEKQSHFFFAILFSLVVFASVSAKAGGITFLKDGQWDLALAKAKIQNKPIFLYGHTSWCGYCRAMEKDVLSTAAVAKVLNSTFISISLDMDKGDGLKLKKLYNTTAYPVMLYFNPKGELVHKSIGATDVGGLIRAVNDALDPGKQFYTLKKKAIAGTLDPVSLNNWADYAERLGEPRTSEIITSYLAKEPSLLKKEGLVELLLMQKGLPTEAHLAELHEYLGKAGQLPKEDIDFMYDQLLEKIVLMAYSKNYNPKSNSLNFDGYKAFVARYRPDVAEIETQKQSIKYYYDRLNYKQAQLELAACFLGGKIKPGVKDVYFLMKEYALMLKMSDVLNEYIHKVNTYTVQLKEKDMNAYKLMALLYLYNELGDQKMKQQLSLRILTDKNASADLKDEVNWIGN